VVEQQPRLPVGLWGTESNEARSACEGANASPEGAIRASLRELSFGGCTERRLKRHRSFHIAEITFAAEVFWGENKMRDCMDISGLILSRGH